MAKIQFGPAIAAASGSIGGVVFSHGPYGPYIRRRAIPTISTTSYAMAAKARFTAASQAWQGLPAASQEAWRQWALTNPVTDTLGMAQPLSGVVAFVGNHCRAAIYGTAPLTDPPVVAAPAPLGSLTLGADIGIGDVDLTFTPTPTGANDHLWIDACVVDSPAIKYVGNYLRHIGESPGAAASPYIFEALVAARFGTLQVGQTLHVRVAILNDTTYQLSAPLVDSAVVVST